MAQSKVELLLDIKDRMKTGLAKARDNVTKSTKDMKDKIQSVISREITAKNSVFCLLTTVFHFFVFLHVNS